MVENEQVLDLLRAAFTQKLDRSKISGVDISQAAIGASNDDVDSMDRPRSNSRHR